MKNNKEQTKVKTKTRRLKPSEFMEVMARIKIIDAEIKSETKLYDAKIKALELEKEYLWNQVDPKK